MNIIEKKQRNIIHNIFTHIIFRILNIPFKLMLQILPKFNKLALFLTSTSLFLAINSSAKVIFSGLLYNIFILNTAVFAFLTTFSIYGLNKITDIKEDIINNPERANITKKLEPVLKFSVYISLILSLILGFFDGILVLLVLLFPLAIGILYSMRLSNNLPRLKDITGVKNITIALSWATGSTFLPVIYLLEKKVY